MKRDVETKAIQRQIELVVKDAESGKLRIHSIDHCLAVLPEEAIVDFVFGGLCVEGCSWCDGIRDGIRRRKNG